MTINYSIDRLSVPSSKKKDGKSFYKYTLLFENVANRRSEPFLINIRFASDSIISNVNVSESLLKTTFNANSVSIEIANFSNGELRLHVFIYDSENSKATLTSNVQDVSFIESKKHSEEPKHVEQLSLKYNIVVAAALHEELVPFLKNQHWEYVDEKKIMKSFRVSDLSGTVYHILCYSANMMGMAYNGVALTKLIEKYQPQYVLFIGTCAGFKKSNKTKQGDVLIPDYIYEYSSGKHEKKKFNQEHRNYNVSSVLVSLLNDMLSKRYRRYNFNVEHSCGFCSGGSVVNSPELRKQIQEKANRKVLGFDMEAYVIAIINHIYDNVEAFVIKGIMDFGSGKNDVYKNKAKSNSARVATDLIKYIVNNQRLKAS